MSAVRAAPEIAWWREPTRGQWVTFLAAWVGWILDAFDFTIYAVVIPQLTKEFGVSQTAAYGSLTLTLLLRLLGGVAAGAMADRWGRKLPLMISLVWFAVFDGAIALAPSFTWILVLRTLFGFGMGAEWSSGATLAMENWPERSRGIASGILQGSWAVGYLLAGVAASLIAPHFGWRGLFVVAAVPALLVLPIRIWVPESEAWKQGELKREAPVSLGSLLQGALLRRIIWASLLMSMGFTAYYGLSMPYPTLVQTTFGQGLSGLRPLLVLFNVGMMAGAVVTGWVAARKSVVLAITVPALLTLPILPLYVGYQPALVMLGAFLGGAIGAGYTGVTPLLLTSLFPAKIRARCVGLVYHAGACIAAAIPTLIGVLHDRAGLTTAQTILVIVGSGQVLLVVALWLRPRGALEPMELPAAPQTAALN